ncbi:hypothetical protein [Dyadobacter sp.]|uniref:hypothetical protein n=1 Tax=Dyadobacter sp. TaxID=1914288 RepID=UPI003F72ABD0
MDEKIISGIIGGSIVLVFRIIYELVRDNIKEKKDAKKKDLEEEKKLRVGEKSLKILGKDILYQYEPNKVSIEKIVEEFGTPTLKYDDDIEAEYVYDEDKTITIYKYEFQNALVLFSTFKNKSDIISITLFSRGTKYAPVNCRLSFEEDDAILGKAVISDIIIKEYNDIKSGFNIHESWTDIKASYFYRQIKHLTFIYRIEGQYENIDDTKGKKIEQVCVTEFSPVCPMLTFFDTFYN